MEVNLNNLGSILSIVVPIISFGAFVWRSNNKQFKKLDEKFTGKIEKLDGKIEGLDIKFTEKIEGLDIKIQGIKSQVDRIQGHLEAFDRYLLLDKIDRKIDKEITKKEE